MKANQHPLFRKYSYIRQAVNNSRSKNYPQIGGRGIQCNFRNFWDFARAVESDIGMPPYPDSILSRINLDLDYEVGNFLWTDRATVVKLHHPANKK